MVRDHFLTGFLPLLLALVATDSTSRFGEDKDPLKDDVVIKRRSAASAEELRKQLLRVPELGLDQPGAKLLYGLLPEKKDDAVLPPADFGPRFVAQAAVNLRRADLFQLPWRTGPDCQLGKETAERLHVLSVGLRDLLRASVPSGDIRPDPEKFRKAITEGGDRGPKPAEWRKPEAIPTLLQMLQVENSPIRMMLVDLLARIEGKLASIALAQRALFDLSPEVRAHAVKALVTRPALEYQKVFVDGLRWPWAPVADHAGEALVALKVKTATPNLVALLKEPDPRLPFAVPVQGKNAYFVKELVRINHLCNCMVCHAPSFAKDDLVRGRVPVPGEDPPPAYYQERSGNFVRASVTFLHQDFSVFQPVANPLKWPTDQRFDYLLRMRPLTKNELANFLRNKDDLPRSYEQREAVLFALRGITGRDAGSKSEDWTELLKGIRKENP